MRIGLLRLLLPSVPIQTGAEVIGIPMKLQFDAVQEEVGLDAELFDEPEPEEAVPVPGVAGPAGAGAEGAAGVAGAGAAAGAVSAGAASASPPASALRDLPAAFSARRSVT